MQPPPWVDCVTKYEPALASPALAIDADADDAVKPSGPVQLKTTPTPEAFNFMESPAHTGLLDEAVGAGKWPPIETLDTVRYRCAMLAAYSVNGP